MLLIACPWCGPRDEIEYVYGGQAGLTRPGPPDAVDDAAWTSYLFFRDNPKGPARERWRHAFGCRQWFDVERDTTTHDILGVFKLGGAE